LINLTDSTTALYFANNLILSYPATMTKKPDTIVSYAAIDHDEAYGSVIPPIYLSTSYSFPEYGKKGPYNYARTGNPTRDELGSALAALEGGVGSIITGSGMGAMLTVFHLLEPTDLLLAPHDCYGGTIRLLNALAAKKHFKILYVDFGDAKALDDAFAQTPKMVLVETPSNPLLRLTDIEDIVARAKKASALVVADNTFMSPALQNPLRQGADIVVHSTTKYINGHSDVVGGAIVSGTKELHEQMAWWGNCLGTTGSAFDSYLTLRGLRTLMVRMRQQEKTAASIAEFLSTHPAVTKVYYPGLASHPQHKLAQKQQKGFGSMLSFEIAGDNLNVPLFLEKLELFPLAASLGGFESLVAHVATVTHAMMSAEEMKTAGISQNLLRLSIGLADADDLIADLKRGLDAIA